MEIEIVKSKMANALTSADSNHVIAVADDVYDEDKEKYQSEINDQLMAGKIYNAEEEKWVQNISNPTAATTDTLGGIKIGYSEKTGEKKYRLQLDENDNAYVHVPWINTQNNLLPATAGTLGGVKVTGTKGLVMTDTDKDVLAVNFDTTNYSAVEDITAYEFSLNTVASPDVVNKIVEAKLQYVFSDILDTPL